MTTAAKPKTNLSVKTYRGDAKTLLAFNLPNRQSAKSLAGFTIEVEPQGEQSYYIHNNLQFQRPGDHAQDPKEPPYSSINAPIHKFRWLHVPGSAHQGLKPFMGPYKYTVTARYFDAKGSLQPLDPNQSVTVDVNVAPFQKEGVELGFTRGFVQSQAFVHHFGLNALIRPKGKDLLFDTSQESGSNAQGQRYTFQDEYGWLGFTAREKIFGLLNEVKNDASLHLDVFAYDLNEPDLIKLLLQFAQQGRIRVILDNATLHHNTKSPTSEDQFEKLFTQKATGKAAILRGKFGRYSHDKIFILSKNGTTTKVLTGSTNFSVTGLYVNSNHVLIFTDPKVTAQYAQLFQEAWQDKASAPAFRASTLAKQTFPFSSNLMPKTEITFSPHDQTFADTLLKGVASRIQTEGKQSKAAGSVLFAVMEMDKGTSPVYTALKNVHNNGQIFSYGISDSPGGIELYKPGKRTGVLVTGKPQNTILPKPFDQVPNIPGVGHQVHHKFVVCGFNTPNAVVYCGSSNLASGGENLNGDNLLAIHDGDIATAFALEALALVDHFNFLDGVANGPKAKGKASAKTKKPIASKQQAAASAGWFLSTNDKWVEPYFNTKDLHCVDRQLFG
jgi:phosphatidylserine/phosphatidylglycerophosphate/cardiolipin synthase-like enzyme